jgi:hypothetical protein
VKRSLQNVVKGSGKDFYCTNPLSHARLCTPMHNDVHQQSIPFFEAAEAF